MSVSLFQIFVLDLVTFTNFSGESSWLTSKKLFSASYRRLPWAWLWRRHFLKVAAEAAAVAVAPQAAVAPAAADLAVARAAQGAAPAAAPARADPVVQVAQAAQAVQTAQAQVTLAVPAVPAEATAATHRQQKVTAGDAAPMTGWAMLAAVVLMMASAIRAAGAKKMRP